MNINLREVVCTSKDGDRFWKLNECYIRGSSIKYLRLPEEAVERVVEEEQGGRGQHWHGTSGSYSSSGRVVDVVVEGGKEMAEDGVVEEAEEEQAVLLTEGGEAVVEEDGEVDEVEMMVVGEEKRKKKLSIPM